MCVFSKLLRCARSVRWRVVALVIIAVGTPAWGGEAATVALPPQISSRVFLTGPVWTGERNAMLCWTERESAPVRILSWACPLLGEAAAEGGVQLVDLLLGDGQAARLKLGLQRGNCAGEAAGCSTAARLRQCTDAFLTSVDKWGKKPEVEERGWVTGADLAALKEEAEKVLLNAKLGTSVKNVRTLTRWLGEMPCSLEELQKKCALRKAALGEAELSRPAPSVGPAPPQLEADVLAYRDAIVAALLQFGWIDADRVGRAIADVLDQQDVVITTAQIPNKPAPKILTEALLARMQPGALVLDLAAATGGNCAASQPDAWVEHGGVRIFAPTRLTNAIAHTASKLYAANIAAFLNALLPAPGGPGLALDDPIVRATLLTNAGAIAHPALHGF